VGAVVHAAWPEAAHDSLSTNFTEFETAFDTAPEPRLVLLLSPSRPTCLRGASAAEKLLRG